MSLINVTNRTITIVDNKGYIIVDIHPSGIIVAASITPQVLERIFQEEHEIEVVTYNYTEVSGLPKARPDTIYIVTYAVLQALKGARSDVIAPDTSPTSIIRQDGRVVGVQRFRKL